LALSRIMKKPTLDFAQKPLVGQFQKRYKRFFADVTLAGDTVIAHVANTGSLKTCLHTGESALLTPATNPERKLRFSLEAIQTPWKVWIGVNTARPNHLVKLVYDQGLNPDWKRFSSFKPEYKISKETRLDGLLQDPAGKLRFVEVKNVTMATGDCENLQGTAHFPDGKTERGRKHIEELMALVAQGHEAELIFIVQRTDCVRLSPAWQIDPDYSEALVRAVASGVKVSIWAVAITLQGFDVLIDKPLSLDLQRV